MAVQMLVLVLLLPFQVLAYPSSQTCDFACIGGYTPGSSYGYMGIANIGATTGATCAIATDIPSGGYTSGTSYTITVSSTTALACDIGTLGGQTVANTISKTTSQTYTWVAPSTCSGSVKFRALCGAGGSIDEMWVAEEVTEAGCTTTTSSSESSASTSSTDSTSSASSTTSAGSTSTVASDDAG